MTNDVVNKTVFGYPHEGMTREYKRILFKSVSKKDYLNIYTDNYETEKEMKNYRDFAAKSDKYLCISKDEALQIRDALIKIYPINDYPTVEKFDPTKPVQTRDGRKAKILTTEYDSGSGRNTVAMIWGNDNKTIIDYYHNNGRVYDRKDKQSLDDLINIEE